MVQIDYICNQNIYGMNQTAFTVRMDAEVKKKFDELCKEFGMSANTAFNIFARAVIRQERIPFEVESERQAALEKAWATIESIRERSARNGVGDMTMEEIDEEIRLCRQERRRNDKE